MVVDLVGRFGRGPWHLVGNGPIGKRVAAVAADCEDLEFGSKVDLVRVSGRVYWH